MDVASFRTDHYIVESEIGVQEIVIANTLQCSVSLWNYLLTARQVVSAIRRTSKMGATKKCKCFKWNNFSGWSTCNTVVHSTAASIRGTHMEEWVHSADTGCWRRCIFRLPLAMWAITSRQFIASVRLNGGSSKTCWIIVTHNSHAWCKQISDTLIHPHYIVECENFVAKKKNVSKKNLSQIIHYVTTQYALQTILSKGFFVGSHIWREFHSFRLSWRNWRVCLADDS